MQYLAYKFLISNIKIRLPIFIWRGCRNNKKIKLSAFHENQTFLAMLGCLAYIPHSNSGLEMRSVHIIIQCVVCDANGLVSYPSIITVTLVFHISVDFIHLCYLPGSSLTCNPILIPLIFSIFLRMRQSYYELRVAQNNNKNINSYY